MYEIWTKDDERIISSAENLLKSNSINTFEERKYFMDIMIDFAKKKDRKKLVTLLGSGVILVALLAYKCINK